MLYQCSIYILFYKLFILFQISTPLESEYDFDKKHNGFLIQYYIPVILQKMSRKRHMPLNVGQVSTQLQIAENEIISIIDDYLSSSRENDDASMILYLKLCVPRALFFAGSRGSHIDDLKRKL